MPTAPSPGRPSFLIGGLPLCIAEAPALIADSMGKAFSMSRSREAADSVMLTAAFRDDGAFAASLPPFVRERYDGLPESEDPVAFPGPDGQFCCLVRSGGTASAAVVSADGRTLRLDCQRLTGGKGPLHFQSVLIPALKHLLLRRGKLLVHAGCVADSRGRGVLFVGLSGAGKTTTCIALTRAGFRYVSDDLTVLSFRDGKALVEGIREHMNLTARTIDFFPELSRYRDEVRRAGQSGKVPVDPVELFGSDRVADRAVIDSVMVIVIGKDGPRLVPVPAPAILNVILQNHTFETGMPIPRSSMDILWSILGSVRAFRLLTGPDPSAMGDRVFREFHDGAPSRPVPAPAARARKPPVTLSADAAATLLRGVLGHTLDGRTHAGILPVVSGTAQLFRHHRLEAHLARWSRDTGTEVPGFDPDRVLSNAAALALSMERTVETVHAALGASGIPALLLRGPAVSKRYYPAETLRFFRDIDLLVPKDRLQQAAEVLRSLGYKPDRDLDYWGKRGEWPFSDGTRIVELHWEAYPSPFDELDGLRGEELWQGHDTIEVGSANVACLSRDHLLLSSMLHAAYEHYFDRLVRFVDVRQMVKRDGDAVDWDRIGGMIRTTGTSLAVVKELECMDAVLPVPVPKSWRKDLRASAFWKMAADLALPNDAVISGKKGFHSLRRRLFRSVLKLSR